MSPIDSTSPQSQFETWMRNAISLARTARDLNEVPIGCVIIDDASGRIIGRGYNRREIDEDPTAHAELLALRQAATHRGHWRLLDCTLVVTLEPCPMCAGAIVNSRISRVIFGASDPKAGAARSLYSICDDPRLNHRAEVVSGVLKEECGALLSEFFREKRAMGRK